MDLITCCYQSIIDKSVILQVATKMIDSDDPKQLLIEAESMKKLAFCGVAVSTVATLVAIICVPMLCTYMQNVQSNLQDEISFCRTRAIGLRGEFTKVIFSE